MKRITFLFSLVLIVFAAQAQTVEGLWKTIDDETGKAKSIVKIYKNDGKLYGQVIKVLNKVSGEIPKCDKCKGNKKNKNIEGMTIVSDLTLKKGKWQGDKSILDPEKGKYYDCKIWLENNKTLNVRGSVGPIYRTQTWHKLK
jgi:uncharacterized protein (DUF2147 family)